MIPAIKGTKSSRATFSSALILAVNGCDNSEYAMDKQPCRGNVKNCEIVYSGNTWNRKSNDAQNKTQDCKSKFPVVAFLTDCMNNAQYTVHKEQQYDTITDTDEGP